jgi:predicted metal-dependent hydrolase
MLRFVWPSVLLVLGLIGCAKAQDIASAAGSPYSLARFIKLKEASAPIIATWEAQLRVKVKRVFVQHMKTKWGSCNHQRGTIRLNTELAKKPRECLEYLVVHEMVHLLEPTHNARLVALMEQCVLSARLRKAA